MANYNNLKTSIQQVIRTNGNEEITGAILQQSLLSMINSLGKGYQFMGIATPATNPGTPDQKVFYIAYEAGGYVNFDGYILKNDEIAIFIWDSVWYKYKAGIDRVFISQDTQTGAITIQVGEQTPIVLEKNIIEGNVTNNPDEVDITNTEDNKLQFKDRPNINGMGYKILRAEKTFAAQVTDENTIYEIRYEFDLGGQEFIVPFGCVFRFNGGNISNGTITGNGVKLENLYNSFKNVAINDVYTNETLTDCAIDRTSYQNDTEYLNNLFQIRAENVRFIKPYTFTITINDYYGIVFGNNTKIDFNNSIIQLSATDKTKYAIFQIAHNSNLELSNFNIIGDVIGHIGDNGEWGHGIHISNMSNNIVIKNAKIEECWGDGIDIIEYEDSHESFIGPPTNIILDNCKCYRNRRQGLSIEAGKHIKIINSEFRFTGAIKFTAPGAGIDIEPFSVNNDFVEDIDICDCIITDNCQNSEDLTIPEFKILANTNVDLHAGENNIRVKDCVAGYTEVKDSFGVEIINSNIESITFYNNDKINCLDNTFGALYIQEANNANIKYNVINSINRTIKGWAHGATTFLINPNVAGMITNNTILSYTDSALLLNSDILFSNNTIIQKEIGGTSDKEVLIYTRSKDAIIANNTFDLKKPIRLTIFDGCPVIKSNVINTDFGVSVSNPVSVGYDLIFMDNYFVSGRLVFVSGSEKILFIGNNIQSIDNNRAFFKDVVVAKDNEIDKVIVGNGEDKKIIALYDAVRGSNAFYGSYLPGTSKKTVYWGYAIDIGIPAFFNGSEWVGFDGKSLKSRWGTTANRPNLTGISGSTGYMYFDTNLSKPIWWNGSIWVDAIGSAV